MKVWHDDIRPPPEGWVWCRTNQEVKALFETDADVLQISLDHDLGLHEIEEEWILTNPEKYIFMKGQGEETGVDLVKWMVETGNVPPIITIHSWNPPGAAAMQTLFADHGYEALYQPYITKPS